MGQSSSTLANPTDEYFLQLAAREGKADILQLFLQKNPALVFATDPDADKQPDRNTYWHAAARRGHAEALDLLIATARDHPELTAGGAETLPKLLNATNAKGQTPLMLACEGGHEKCVHSLVTAGANVWQADGNSRNALQYAALKGQRACVKLILSRGTQHPHMAIPDYESLKRYVNYTDPYGRCALHFAAWAGDVAAAHDLIKAGATLAPQTTSDCYDSEFPCNAGSTPLHVAALRDHKDFAALLLGCYVKACQEGSWFGDDPRRLEDAYGRSPHRVALDNRSRAIARILDPATLIVELAAPVPEFTLEEDEGLEGSGADSPSGSGRVATVASPKHGIVGITIGGRRGSNGSGAGREIDLEGFVQQVSVKRTPTPDKGNAAAPQQTDMTPSSSAAGKPPRSRSRNARSSSGAAGTSAAGSSSAGAPVAAAALIELAMRRLTCPLSGQVLRDPVVASDGFTYERAALEAWLANGNAASPVTGAALEPAAVYHNTTLKQLLHDVMLAQAPQQ